MAETDVKVSMDNPVGQEIITVAATSSATSAEATVGMHGLIKYIIVVAPNLTTDTTFDFSILDADDDVWFTKTGIADDGDKPIHPDTETGYGDVPVVGNTTFLIEWTTSQTASFTVKVRYWNPKM